MLERAVSAGSAILLESLDLKLAMMVFLVELISKHSRIKDLRGALLLSCRVAFWSLRRRAASWSQCVTARSRAQSIM